MTGNGKRLLWAAAVVSMVGVASGCTIELPQVDCSWINQPDMGGLVCLGVNVIAWSAGAIALIVALLLGLPGAIPT